MVGNLPDQVRFHDHLAMMRKTILLMLLKCSLSIRRIATIRYQKDAKRECQRGNDAVISPTLTALCQPLEKALMDHDTDHVSKST